MAKKKKTQDEVVLERLLNGEGITSLQAIKLYGITRLSAVIFRLREECFVLDEWVKVKSRYGKTHVKRYYMYQSVDFCEDKVK